MDIYPPEPWYAPELRTLGPFTELVGPYLIAMIPSFVQWYLVLNTTWVQTGASAFMLSVISTLCCAFLCMAMCERKVGFLREQELDRFVFYMPVGCAQFCSALLAWMAHGDLVK